MSARASFNRIAPKKPRYWDVSISNRRAYQGLQVREMEIEQPVKEEQRFLGNAILIDTPL